MGQKYVGKKNLNAFTVLNGRSRPSGFALRETDDPALGSRSIVTRPFPGLKIHIITLFQGNPLTSLNLLEILTA